MAKLSFLVFFLYGILVQAKSLQLELYGEVSLPQKITFKGEDVGGLSGLKLVGTKLYAVSDDRGKHGRPRFYELDFKIENAKPKLSVNKVIHLKNIDKKWILDLEGMSALSLSDGNFIFSSEGDNNVKPRSMPRIFTTNAYGKFKSEIPIPEKFLPNPTGRQIKGIENNRGFEGLTVSEDGRDLFLLNEFPIMGDQSTREEASEWLRLVQFTKEKDDFKITGEYPYLLDSHSQNTKGVEVFRGIADLVHWQGRKFISLERGVRLGTKGLGYTAVLYLADFQGTQDVSSIPNLAVAKVSSAAKEKLIDLEQTLRTEKIENFEGLAWGPVLPDGRKSLLVISDNNFSSREKTQLLVIAVKEVE